MPTIGGIAAEQERRKMESERLTSAELAKRIGFHEPPRTREELERQAEQAELLLEDR